MPRAEREAEAQELLKIVGLAEFATRMPFELSGGMRQRVSIARALMGNPDIVLMDEPFGALDAAIRRDLRRWLRGVHEATGSTTIFVTHDQEEAFELADRVVVMGAGRIEQTGSADAIHDHPATPFVARFMGATVELPVSIHAGRAEGPGLDLTALPRRALADGTAQLFARPEDILPVPDSAAPWRIAARASNGAHLRLLLRHLDLGEAEADVPRRAVQAEALVPDAPVRLKIEAGTLFPADRRAAAAAGQPIPFTPSREKTR